MKKSTTLALIAGGVAALVTAAITTVCGKKTEETSTACIEGECAEVEDSVEENSVEE